MAMEKDVIKIKQIRRQMLTHLNILYPSLMQIQILYRTLCGLDPSYAFSLFEKDISYFRQKGWIEFPDEKIGGLGEFCERYIRLTAAGKEIAERTASDPALEI